MKRILLSIMTIALVSGGAYGATQAFFSDTEKNIGNTFSAGTIDIAVDNNNPWTRSGYALVDMKPSQTDYIDFVVHNVGTNPVNLYKKLYNFTLTDEVTSEQECIDGGGTWDGQVCNRPDPTVNLDDWINYDLKVELYDDDPSNPGAKLVWWENIYADGVNTDKKLGDLENNPIFLGMIPVGKWMKVYQSYHMVSDTGNVYQGDKLSFDIELTAEQLGKSALRLENKHEVAGQSYTMWWDTTYADLTYKVKDRKFDYTLAVNDQADGSYDLVAWEGYPNWTWDGGPAVIVLANVTVSGDDPVVTGSVELNQDLTNAKVWLVQGTHTPGTTTNLPWPLPNALFETGLMDYYDADL